MNENNIWNILWQIYDKQKEWCRIQYLIEKFLSSRNKNERYASFDYCYNYFHNFYKNDKIYEISNTDNLENSCLHLWFYLASWWMMRWSSFLLWKSLKHFVPLIIEISKLDKSYFDIDIDNYNDINIEKLLDLKKIIIKALWEENNPSDTLISKIMLWIFWNIPAFDRFLKEWLKVSWFNKKSLNLIKNNYLENKKIFDNLNIKTINFNTWKDSEVKYKKAKLIDMYWFMKWQLILNP